MFIRTYVEQGAHCVIVDVGHSYRGICDLLEGYYFTYSEENPNTIDDVSPTAKLSQRTIRLIAKMLR